MRNALDEQLDWHWRHQMRPRLDGLTDDEYFWQPVENCWNVHRDGRIDFTYPPPQPEPFTTIAWRLAHVIVGVLAVRNHAHFGGRPADYDSWPYATDATTALAQLDAVYADWHRGVAGLDEAALAKSCGPAEGAFAEESMTTLVLHINREMIHHGAEIALLRDLYAHTMKEN